MSRGTLIYIAGAGHSGSTVLEMLLTTGRKAVGLGEAWNVVNEPAARIAERVCSCGALAAACSLWAPVVARLSEEDGQAPPVERYRAVLARAAALFGDATVIIDSSKRPDGVGNLCALRSAGMDVRVIHNVRDVRAHAISIIDTATRKTHTPAGAARVFHQWWTRNRQAHAESVRALGRPPIPITHEGLCLQPDETVRHLAAALGQELVDMGVPLNRGTMHSIRGNRVRLPEQADRASRLAYDERWRGRREWRRPYMLMPWVRRYNEQCLRAR